MVSRHCKKKIERDRMVIESFIAEENLMNKKVIVDKLQNEKAAKENVKTVDWIFSILEDSDWGHHKDTYNADIMQSLWYVNRNTQDSLQTSKNKLVAFFKNSTPKEIKALGNIEYPECGHGGGIYRIMLDIINDRALASV